MDGDKFLGGEQRRLQSDGSRLLRLGTPRRYPSELLPADHIDCG